MYYLDQQLYMGKPFGKELDKIWETYKDVLSVNMDSFKAAMSKTLNFPLYIIGSGGSLSACHFAEILHQQTGSVGKAITPLESYYLNKNIQTGNFLIITAGGRNKDILFAFDNAIKNEPEAIIGLCTTSKSLLSHKTSKYSISSTFEFPLKTGKDGFLASNSLLAFFILLARAYEIELKLPKKIKSEEEIFQKTTNTFLKKLDIKYATFQVLHGGWSKPVAVDIESKLTEAALANTLLSDFRNFGHGRHHWFDKKGKNSAVIALISPEEEELAKKTLAILPKEIPVLLLRTRQSGAEGTIDLLIKSFYFINRVGEFQGIDPGRPGVPGFGRKLYNLSYSSFFKTDKSFTKQPLLGIQRKIKPLNIHDLTHESLKLWRQAYERFARKIKNAQYGSVVLDYDRTICSESERLSGPSGIMIKELTKIIQAGFIVGIISGRGASIKTDLRNSFEKKYWTDIFIGYYNGAEIGSLADDGLPNVDEGCEKSFDEIRNTLEQTPIINEIKITRRRFQLTIENINPGNWETLKPVIFQKAMSVREGGFLILESSRSIDIIKRPEVSKLNILVYLEVELKRRKLPPNQLCIGDKGRCPGNDFELLSTEFSLSVNEVSLDLNTCWNIAPLGLRNADACLFYLQSISLKKSYFKIEVHE